MTSVFSLVADAAPQAAGGSMVQTLIMIAVALAFFYFILWRPEQKKRKAMETVRSSLKKGDRVTAMGIVGTVVKVQDKTVILALYEGAKMEILKAAITEVQATSDAVEATDVR
jgi:preprotein translocase subunit YajC